MIHYFSIALLATFAALCCGQSAPMSPCPNIFSYEPPGSEQGRWYGTVHLSTDNTLHSLWLNIVLDSKADIVGNWIGDVTTTDNIDFKIENTKMKIQPGPATSVRFFVQHNLLSKPPRLQAIRLNGREICNANDPLPAIDRPEEESSRPERPRPRPRPSAEDNDRNRQPERPVDSRPVGNQPVFRPEDVPSTRPVRPEYRPSDEGPAPVYVHHPNPPIGQTDVKPYSIGDGYVPEQNLNRRRPGNDYQLTTATPIRKSSSGRGEDDYGNPEASPDYWPGGSLTVVVPNRDRRQNQCGKVTRRPNPNPLVVNGRPTQEGQWPWQIALYQTQTVDNKYICGGTLVSRSHVVTAAHCVSLKGSTRLVNKATLTVYLGKHNLRTSIEGVQIKLVENLVVHPQYNATSYTRDLGVLTLRGAVDFTDWVRPACLWPDDRTSLSDVIGKRGSVVGWGFDDKGIATEELSLVEMPVVNQETCIRSYSEFFARFTSEYTYCAGYRNGTSVCNGDSGGGMVFNIDGTWYLRGLVSLSVARTNEYRCDPTHYVVFTDLAKFTSWIREQIAQ